MIIVCVGIIFRNMNLNSFCLILTSYGLYGFTFRQPIYALVVPLDGDSVLARNILELITFHP